MSLIEEGKKRKLITTIEDNGVIKQYKYVNHPKPRNANPEEHVQADTFLKLVIDYGYKADRIKQFVSVKMGSDTKDVLIV